MKRRMLIQFLCLFIVIGAAGCVKSPTLGEPGGEAPAVITVWYALEGKNEEELLKQLERINNEHFEVVVQGEKVSKNQFVETLWNVQAGGEGPEIIIAERETLFALYEKGTISPVLANDVQIFPAAKAVYTFNQVSYAMPWLTDVPVFYYRKDKIQEAPSNLTDVIEKKIPIVASSLNTALFSPWWKAEGGSFSLSGDPALNSLTNNNFLNKIISLRAERNLFIDPQAVQRFIQGDAGCLLGWASDSIKLTQAGIAWESIPLQSIFGTSSKVLLNRTIGIANSSIKTVPALEDSIKMVEEELLGIETQKAMQKAGGSMPVSEYGYEGSKARSLEAQVGEVLENAWVMEGQMLDWKFLSIQDKAWANTSGGLNVDAELEKAQQTALELIRNL